MAIAATQMARQPELPPEVWRKLLDNARFLAWKRRRSSPNQDADELFSAALVGIHDAIRTYQPNAGANLVTWSSIKVKSAIRDYTKKKLAPAKGSGSRGRIPILRVEMPQQVVGPSADFIKHIELRQRLPLVTNPVDRFVIYQFLQGFRFREIGDMLMSSEQHAYQCYQRAVRQMRGGLL